MCRRDCPASSWCAATIPTPLRSGTADCPIRDGDGWFWFVDRLKDSIRRRGENISSYEVEAVLAAHPGVAAAAVVTVPAQEGEDEVLAILWQRTDLRAS